MKGWVNSCYEGTREKFKSPLDVKVEASGSQSLAHRGCMSLKGYRNGCRKLQNHASPSASLSAKVIHREYKSVLHKIKLKVRILGSTRRKGITDLTDGFVLIPFLDPV